MDVVKRVDCVGGIVEQISEMVSGSVMKGIKLLVIGKLKWRG